MRFAWKVFFPCLTVLVIAFSVFGYILTTNAFDTALSQEKQRALDKLTMLSKVVASYTADFGYYTDTAALVGVMESVATGDLAAAQGFGKGGAGHKVAAGSVDDENAPSFMPARKPASTMFTV